MFNMIETVTGRILTRPTHSPDTRVQLEHSGSGVFCAPGVLNVTVLDPLPPPPCSVLSWVQNPAAWLAMFPCGVFCSFPSRPPALLSSHHRPHNIWHVHTERSGGPQRRRRRSHSGDVRDCRNGAIGIDGCVINCSHFHLDVKSV